MAKNLLAFGNLLGLSLFISLFFMGSQLQAQITTSSITGLITDAKGEALPGATIVAIHVPSGTRYGSTSNVKGRYTLPAVRIGGPYKVTVSFVGFQNQVREGIFTSLGSASDVSIKLSEEGKQLDEVVVKTGRADIFSSERTGASTTLGRDALMSLPTIGARSISDFTKYNPQGNGRSFGGQDSRLNNFTIDGSVFNNGFGLGSDAQAGGRTGSTAISLDAIDQIQVNVAPFDVRQSGFVGAGLNAVTRSGTNEFSGSAYTFWSDNSETFVGRNAGGNAVTPGAFKENIKGFRIGGPLIKDKLFFFVNGEMQDRTAPAHAFVASGSDTPGIVTPVLKSDLEALSSFMRTKFGYETGPYEGYSNATKSKKFLARLDYNLSDKHKVTLRYTQHDSDAEQNVSNSNSAGNGNRITSTSLSYKNSGYIIQDNTRSVVAELNSSFGSKASNNFIIGYDQQIEDRATFAPQFPTVDILKNGAAYISLGLDPFTPYNKLNYGTFHITNNLSLYKGNHSIVLGVNYENYKSNNSFYAASGGVYVYNSLDDFYAAANSSAATSPVVANRFQLRYSALADGALPMQVLKANKFDFYAQDDYQIANNFKLTYGLRASIIGFGNTALQNTTAAGYKYVDQQGNPYTVNTGELPSTMLLWEPRVGFNWDVNSDKSLQVRGGSGVFTGRPPYVWLSNQIGGNGILTGFTDVPATTAYPFRADPTTLKPANPTLPATYELNATNSNYNFPQVWKTNVAIDKKLPWGLVGTAEFVYSKNVNAVNYFNANLPVSTTTLTGPDNRPLFSATRINSAVTSAVILANTNLGNSYLMTFKLEKPATKGFSGMVAYTFGQTRDLMSAGSTASGTLAAIRSYNGVNSPSLAYGDNDIPQRLIGTLNYRLEYGGLFGGATQFTMGYDGGTYASRYSYTVSGDLNGDGYSGNDLLYVPTKASSLTFLPLTVGTRTYSPEEQATAFDKFIDQDPYLSTRRGQYAERNGAILPWLNRFDVSLIQEVFIKVGSKGKRNTLQFRVDMKNAGNWLDSRWGVGTNRVSTVPLSFVSRTANGTPQYRFTTQALRVNNVSSTVLLQDSFSPSISVSDVWTAQFGLRYIFN